MFESIDYLYEEYMDRMLDSYQQEQERAYEAYMLAEIQREYDEGIRSEEEDDAEYERLAANDEYDRY
jgi:hypothetical protein